MIIRTACIIRSQSHGILQHDVCLTGSWDTSDFSLIHVQMQQVIVFNHLCLREAIGPNRHFFQEEEINGLDR